MARTVADSVHSARQPPGALSEVQNQIPVDAFGPPSKPASIAQDEEPSAEVVQAGEEQ